MISPAVAVPVYAIMIGVSYEIKNSTQKIRIGFQWGGKILLFKKVG